MKTTIHENMDIEDFERFYTTIKREHPELLGAEWDKEKRVLKLFYKDAATKITEETLRNFKIPTILRFRKKVTPPKLDAATVVSATENEFIVECFDVNATRKEVERKLSEFEEVKT